MTDVFASRLAAVSGRPVPVPSMAPVDQPGGLQPKQLQWLRDNVPAFSICERMALAAERHRDEMRKAAGL